MKEEVKRVTIYDIAEAAEVSRQTVSRVLNNVGSIRPETKSRVLKVMNDLDYHPDPLARGLALNRTHVLGVLTPSFTGYNYGRILEGAESRASDLGYLTLISRTISDSRLSSEPVDSNVFEKQRIEGLLILYNGSMKDTYQILNQINPAIPIVTIGYAAENPRVTCLNFDNKGGAGLAVEHLLKGGKKRILNLCGPAHLIEVNHRIEGYEQMLSSFGCPTDPDLIVHCESWEVEDGWKMVKSILNKGIQFDSIFAHSDLLALGAIHALKEVGLTIPGDIPVIGFDDQPISAFLETPLTTVHRPNFGFGKLAMEKLIQVIRNDKESTSFSIDENHMSEKEELKPYLVLRSSCP